MAEYKVLCGVPKEDCSGDLRPLSSGLGGSNNKMKSHSNHDQAFACHRRYLLSLGYEQTGAREFHKEGQPYRILTKRSRFGAKLRKGKGGEGANSGNRHMPSKPRTGGACTSC